MQSTLDEIAAERKRQIEMEGFTQTADDRYSDGELAMAAACYACGSQSSPWRPWITDFIAQYWPWPEKWWKPQGGRRRCLVKAGALIVAEIERFDRQLAKEQAK